jgi:hypothetical protein
VVRETSIYQACCALLRLPHQNLKTRIMKKVFTGLMVAVLMPFCTLRAQSKTTKPSVAVVSIDVNGLPYDNIAFGSLVRLELEKLDKFEVLDKYDVANTMKLNKINPAEAFGKNQLVQVGTLLKADKMLTGAAELFGEKVIMTLRLVNVKEDKIEKISVLEYINDLDYLQRMVRSSLKDLLDLPLDKEEFDRLVNLERPVITDKSTYSLSGFRFGIQVYNGPIADRLTDAKDQGGYGANSFGTVFGYQLEKQYLTTGHFQAVAEAIISINSIESGMFSPSLALIQGLRFHGWEIGFGPVIRLTQSAQGYYQDGQWIRADSAPEGSDVQIIRQLDSRGNLSVSTGLLIAAGKTFTSGYLHLPVNVYWSPIPEYGSSVVGVMLGFTIADKDSK